MTDDTTPTTITGDRTHDRTVPRLFGVETALIVAATPYDVLGDPDGFIYNEGVYAIEAVWSDDDGHQTRVGFTHAAIDEGDANVSRLVEVAAESLRGQQETDP